MRIAAISDLHGHLPSPSEFISQDVLLIAGDVVPLQYKGGGDKRWLSNVFAPWCQEVRNHVGHIVGIAGNHDFIFEDDPDFAYSLPWDYLLDSTVIIQGRKFYGTPYQPWFGGWAFNLDEPKMDSEFPGAKNASEPELMVKFGFIPEDTDVLLTHCPPYRILDEGREGTSLGSWALRNRVEQLKLKLHVFGHIHLGHGKHDADSTQYGNAAIVDEHYIPVHPPLFFHI